MQVNQFNYSIYENNFLLLPEGQICSSLGETHLQYGQLPVHHFH